MLHVDCIQMRAWNGCCFIVNWHNDPYTFRDFSMFSLLQKFNGTGFTKVKTLLSFFLCSLSYYCSISFKLQYAIFYLCTLFNNHNKCMKIMAFAILFCLSNIRYMYLVLSNLDFILERSKERLSKTQHQSLVWNFYRLMTFNSS